MRSIILLIILGFSLQCVNAQKLQNDSAAIISAAKQDAKHFSYDKPNKKAIINNLHNLTSDYFKPSANTSSVANINDSLYVRRFKIYAIRHVRARRTTKTLLFVGGGAVLFLGLLVAAVVSAGPGLTN